jgi:hypothetical protein
MPIIATGAQDALVIAVRSVTGGRRPSAGRLRVARAARVVDGVCRPAELRELAAMLRDGRELHAGPAPVSRLGTLRDALEDAVSTVLGDVELHSEIELRSTPPGTTADRGPGPDPAGWRTALRFMLLVDVPPGAAWTLHAPGSDVTVDRPGSLVVHGADVVSSWRHADAPEPVIACSARTLLRRGRRTAAARRSA